MQTVPSTAKIRAANVSNKKTATCVTVFKVFRSAEAVGSVVAITVNRSC